MIWRRSRRIRNNYIDPDQVLLDSQNRPGFDTQQFEGVLEQSISRRAITLFAVFTVLVLTIFGFQLYKLQIKQGEYFFGLSEKNRLQKIPVFAERGVIFDRNGVAIGWNVPAEGDEPFLHREYATGGGYGHLLGYVGYPTRDRAGFFWRHTIEGKSGVEKVFSDHLSGINGSKVVEVDALGNITAENMMIPAEPGKNLHLTIHAGIQSALYNAIKDLAETGKFQGGAGLIMNIKNGELIAMTSYPEFDANVLSQGKDVELINQYATDTRKVYLNRSVSGLYTPGSTVKPYIALGALQEGVITPQTTIFSSGKVEIPNRWDPSNPQVFRDWQREGHGPTNVYTAIAESVNTFFYAIGGGLGNQQALGISRINDYLERFGIGESTGFELENDKQGIVPSPEWKLKTFKDGAWRQGDTYNSAIGQFGFQVSLLQMLRAVGALGNSGNLVTPHVQKDQVGILPSQQKKVTGIDEKNYQIIRDAMRETVTRGTARLLNVPYVSAAAKTGTAQTGAGNRFMNSWTTGFFPTEDPTYAFVVMMDSAPSTNEAGATRTMRTVFDWIQNNDPEFFTK